MVFSQFLVGGVEVRLIAAGAGHSRLEIIRDQYLRYPTKELKGIDMGLYPLGQALACGCLDIGIAAGPQAGDKDLGRGYGTGCRIMDGNGLTGIIHKELLARPVALP